MTRISPTRNSRRASPTSSRMVTTTVVVVTTVSSRETAAHLRWETITSTSRAPHGFP
jgi:hypothetical protein